jgi:general secretion pathway protein D
VDSSNSIALRGDQGTVARFSAIARDLDKRAASGTEIRVIWLQHADAEKLLPVLQQLVGQATATVSGNGVTPAQAPISATASAAPSGRPSPVIARYEGANAIIISAPSELQRTLGEVVRQLDTRREQVLVEAIIVEISDTAAKKLGVQFLLGGTPGSNIPFAATNYSNAAPNILTVAGAIGARQLNSTTTTVNGNTTTTQTNNVVSDQLAQAAVNSILGAAGGFAGFATQIGKNGLFGTIINAVQSDTKSNILSTPSVLTLDNQEAKILVGQEIPITTGEKLSNNFDNAFRTVQRENVGIQLEVKPQINAGGAIKLFIRQEVSSIAGPVSNSASDLILNKREIQTTVTIDDGEIVALGGLLDDNERRTIEKIPLLGDLPGIGQLFRSKARSRQKTNLMVFIRPTILKTADDSRALAERRYGYIREMQLELRPDQEPSIDELVRDYMGAVPPAAPIDPTVPAIIPKP